MRKFIKDPNTSVNQSGFPSSAGNRSSDTHTEQLIPGSSVGRYMADSYAKRQMFYYGVEDASAQYPHPNPMQSTQQMMTLLENASPRQIHHCETSDGDKGTGLLRNQ